jgi:hydrogenase/urease accessory protein HupE
MESLFTFFFRFGFDHILDPEGFDHIAYVVALCAVFRVSDWRKTALLVTAFTLGHSLTLALVGLDIIQLTPQQKTWVEMLIPVTIIATAVLNILSTYQENKNFKTTYLLTALFGLIHGLGFSTFFRSSLMPGETGELIQQLFAFNIGVEVGQLVIVSIVLLLSFFVLNILKVNQKNWIKFVSFIAIITAFYLLLK